MATTLSMSCVQNSQDIANNTSNVTVKVIVKWTYGSYNLENQSGSLTIDGTKYSFAKPFNTNQTTSGSATLFSKTVDVKHNDDGTKKLVYSSSYVTGISSSGTLTASGSKTLTAIPRQATLTAAPHFNDEENPTITYNNPAGESVTNVEVAIYNVEGTESFAPYRSVSKTGTSYTFDLDEEITSGGTVRDKLRRACSTTNSMSVRFYIRTTIGENTYRSYLTKTLSIINCTPEMTVSVDDVNPVSTMLTQDPNFVIKGFNTLLATIEPITKKEATIANIKIICDDETVSDSNSATFENVNGDVVEFRITDSRGNSAITRMHLNVISYIPLTCNFTIGSLNATGDIQFTINGNYFNDCFGNEGIAVNNILLVEWRVKENDGEYGEWTTVTPTITDNTYSYEETLTGLDYLSTYTFEARAQDKLNELNGVYVETPEKTVKCQPLFDWGEDDFTFNIPVNMDDKLTVNGELVATNDATVGGKLTVGTLWSSSTTFNGLNIDQHLYCSGLAEFKGFLKQIPHEMTLRYDANTNVDIDTKWVYKRVNLNTVASNIGGNTAFEYNDDGAVTISAGSGVKYVRVYANITIGVVQAKQYAGMIYHKTADGVQTAISGAYAYANDSTYYTTTSIPPRIIEVSEGDTIYLGVTASSAGTCKVAGKTLTWLTVEAIG